MSDTNYAQKRKYYRLRYPRRARPSVKFHDELFHVSEVSEQGIRVVMNDKSSLYRGLILQGTLNLHNEEYVKIQGAILRFDAGEVVFRLDKGPSFKNMVAEQRHIRQKYPAYFKKLREEEVV
ncbi:PilZ domain-containing protein [Vibrio sonorensis]|uniref:PilZ domain-containing protein n=1 Tax=Vibrio sonorensis TaxID=1004316 RepID=UPI0008DAF9CC|nr:PilZ domain-containing protein [Vibrio sonorensis]